MSSMILSIVAAANEGGDAKKPEGGGHGEAAPPAKAGPKVETWNEVLAKVQGLEASIAAKEESLKNIIRQKAVTHDAVSEKTLNTQMKKEYADLRDVVKQYEIARNKLLYRFPERFTKGERTYQRIKLKTLEEMEDQLNLESVISSTVEKAKSKYGLKNKTSHKEAKDKDDSSIEDTPKEHNFEESELLSRPVIIKK